MHKACTLANAQTEAASQQAAQTSPDPGYWAKPPFAREATPVFSPSLDAMIPPDHIVRLLDEILDALDWSQWEQCYARKKGQPPIHPRVLAGVLLYGMLRGVRTSRMLEHLCNHCLDFMWLTEGRAVDHSTLCKFRVRHHAELKGLFRQARRQKLQEALEKAKAQDEERRQNHIDPDKHPSQVCLTDLDAAVMPNKEGGYAPNYTPAAILADLTACRQSARSATQWTPTAASSWTRRR